MESTHGLRSGQKKNVSAHFFGSKKIRMEEEGQ